MTHSKTAIWRTQGQTKGATRATHLTNLTEAFNEHKLSNPFSQGGNWFRKTANRRECETYFKPLGGKPQSETTHTATLDYGHVIRKTDLAFTKKSTFGSQ